MQKRFSSQGLHPRRQVHLVLNKLKNESIDLFTRSLLVIKYRDSKKKNQNFVVPSVGRSIEYLLSNCKVFTTLILLR